MSRRAMDVLDDPGRAFASSVSVRLEVLPKALHHKRRDKAEFYEAFFEEVERGAEPLEIISAVPFEEAMAARLSAVDALHVAAARIVGADEIVTTEQLSKPIHRVTSVAVRTIYPDRR